MDLGGVIEVVTKFVLYGGPILASAGFLYYWGKSGKDWGTTEDDIDEKNDD